MSKEYTNIKKIITSGLEVEKQFADKTPTLNLLSEIMFNNTGLNTNEMDTIKQIQFINTVITELYNGDIIKPYQSLTLKSTINSILPENIPVDSLNELQIENLYNNLVGKVKTMGLFELFKVWNDKYKYVTTESKNNSKLYNIISETIDKYINEEIESDESKLKKTYYLQYGIGRSKYVVNYYSGKKTHPDGSKFYDISIFKNKSKLKAFIDSLKKDGYITESHNINEESKLKKAYNAFFEKAMKIAKIKSPDDLDEKEQKKFFNAISKNWKNGVGAVDGWEDTFEKALNENSQSTSSNIDSLLKYYYFRPTNIPNEYENINRSTKIIHIKNKLLITDYTPKYNRFLNSTTIKVTDLDKYAKRNNWQHE